MASRDFLTELHTLRNFSPFGNTVACFDAEMKVSAGYMKVHVKLKFLLGHLFLGTSGITANRFRTKYKKQIAKYWDGRYRLIVTGQGGRKHFVTPTITFSEVSDAKDAHFEVDVKRFHLGRSFVANRRKKANQCVLYSSAVKSRPKGFLTTLGWKISLGGKREKLVVKQARADLKDAERKLLFDPGGFVVKNPFQIDQVVENYKRNMHLRPRAGLRLEAYRRAGEATTANMRRANDVMGLLRRKGFPDNLLTPVDAGTTTEARPFVKATVDEVSLKQYLKLPGPFPIAAHEFGHKLGNLDEYPAGYNVLGSAEGKNVRKFAEELNIPIPPFSSNTTSLMSLGDRVLPFHYLPLAAAAKQMREQFFGATHLWAKDPANKVMNVDAGIGLDRIPQVRGEGVDEDVELDGVLD